MNFIPNVWLQTASRYRNFLFLALFGFILVLTLYWNIRQQIQLFDHDTFAAAAGNHVRALRTAFHHTLNELSGFNTIFHDPSRFHKMDFRHFSQFLLSRHPSIEVVSWLPFHHEHKHADLVKDHHSFIPAAAKANNPVIISPLPKYFPVQYSVHSDKPGSLMIIKHADEMDAREEIHFPPGMLSRKISTLLQSTHHSEESYTTNWIELFLPVFRNAIRTQDNLLGVIRMVVSVPTLIESAIGHLQPQGVHFCLHDTSSLSDEKALYCHGSRTVPGHPSFHNVQQSIHQNWEFLHSTFIKLAERTLIFQAVPSLRFQGRQFFHGQLWMVMTALLIVYILTLYHLYRIRHSQLRLQTALMAQRILSTSNEALVRADNEMELFKDICRILVKEGGFLSAWIGLKTEAEGQIHLQPIAWEGGICPSPAVLNTSKPDPVTTVMQSRVHLFLQDNDFDGWIDRQATLPIFQPLRNALICPLLDGFEVHGVLVLLGLHFPIKEEVGFQFLLELTDNLSCSIRMRRSERERQMIQEQLSASRDRLRKLTGYLQNSLEAERKRIYQDMHDGLGSILTKLKLDLATLGVSWSSETHEKDRLDNLIKLTDRAVKLMRNTANALRPKILDQFGLGAGLEWLAEEFYKHSGIPCRTEIKAEEPRLEEARETALFRVAQEALTNVARHANARQVVVRMGQDDDSLVLEIEDDGIGISLERIEQEETMGIQGMQERLRHFGGTLCLRRPARGKGTLVEAILPRHANNPVEPL